MPDGGVAVLAAPVLAAAAAALAVSASDRRLRRDAGAAAPTVVDRVRLLGRRVVDGIGPGARRRRSQARVRVIQSLGALAAELEAGQPPPVALARCAGEPSAWPVACGVAVLGGDIAAALVVDGQRQPVLRQLAACWQVAADSGSGLAAAVARLAESARAAEDVRVDLEAQLAAPRATARLLAVLPLVGVGFGLMLDADPLAWLLGSGPGRLCLVAGALLTAIGTWWTGRIAAAVERQL